MPDPISIREAASKNSVQKKFNDPSIIRNATHIDLNDGNITNARFIQVDQLPQIGCHLTTKLFVDDATDEVSLVRDNQDNDFNKNNLTNLNTITLNTQAVNDNQVITKTYVDQFLNDNERTRRDLESDFYDEPCDSAKNNQDNDLNDDKLINLDSIKVNRSPTSGNELANKKMLMIQ